MRKPSDAEIERLITQLIDDHLPKAQRRAAREWIQVRVAIFSQVKARSDDA